MASRTEMEKGSLEPIFSIASLLSDASKAGGRLRLFCGTSPIEPDCDPRNTLLKTRTGKKEFGATAKCNFESFRDGAVSNLPVVEVIPLILLKSRFMVALPLATIIF